MPRQDIIQISKELAEAEDGLKKAQINRDEKDKQFKEKIEEIKTSIKQEAVELIIALQAEEMEAEHDTDKFSALQVIIDGLTRSEQHAFKSLDIIIETTIKRLTQ